MALAESRATSRLGVGRAHGSDLYAELRQRGVFSLTGIRYVLYETKGGLSIVADDAGGKQELVTDGVRAATGYVETVVGAPTR